jgi:hypothetical protein
MFDFSKENLATYAGTVTQEENGGGGRIRTFEGSAGRFTV